MKNKTRIAAYITFNILIAIALIALILLICSALSIALAIIEHTTIAQSDVIISACSALYIGAISTLFYL